MPNVSFDNTKIAFQDKTTLQLRKAQLMFRTIQNPTLTATGVKLLNKAVQWKLPFVSSLVKATLFEQFCGGETREESEKVVQAMHKRGVGSIFDYSIEGKAEEQVFDQVFKEILDIIDYAAGQKAIPFVVFKPTAFGRIELYEKVGNGKELSSQEVAEWERVKERFEAVAKKCHELKVRVMVDAEETWMQDAADQICEKMMEQYNREEPILWNTIQMYRTGRLEYMQDHLERAKQKGYKIGYKIVRGAYMEKERARASEMGYPSPIQPTKQASDDNYNAAVDFILENTDTISAFFGTHNEASTQRVMNRMKEKGLATDSSAVFFGQLYGMSDNLTFPLAHAGYNVAKYLPYGPVNDVVPYLTRRAMENTSVAGQTGRELFLIEKEIERRKSTAG